MFNIGFTEILVVALVSIIVLDKEKVPIFIDFIKVVYKCVISIKFKIKKILKDAGIENLYKKHSEDLYKKHSMEEVNYITGKDGKFYPTYNIDNTPGQSNDSESK